jgi:putative phage-type endonuclease
VSGCPGVALAKGRWSCPDGRLVLRYDAPREEWLEARRLGIGSSDASAVLGVNKWTSPYEVWAEKRGLLRPKPDTDAMDLGRRLEPLIADRWAETSGIPIRKAGLMGSRTQPWQLASVDRLAACGGLVEIKSLSWRVAHEWDDGQVPDHAEAQSQHQLAVTGRGHVHVVGLQDGRTWLERVVVRDDDLIADMVKIEAEFWQMVCDGTEPEVDASAATTDTLNARWPGAGESPIELVDRAAGLRDRIRGWKSVIAGAKDELALAENELRALLGDATVGALPDGSEITWKRNGTFSTRRFAEEHPDLVEHFTRPKPVLDVDAIKAERPDLYAALRARVLRVPAPPTHTQEGSH